MQHATFVKNPCWMAKRFPRQPGTHLVSQRLRSLCQRANAWIGILQRREVQVALLTFVKTPHKSYCSRDDPTPLRLDFHRTHCGIYPSCLAPRPNDAYTAAKLLISAKLLTHGSASMNTSSRPIESILVIASPGFDFPDLEGCSGS